MFFYFFESRRDPMNGTWSFIIICINRYADFPCLDDIITYIEGGHLGLLFSASRLLMCFIRSWRIDCNRDDDGNGLVLPFIASDIFYLRSLKPLPRTMQDRRDE